MNQQLLIPPFFIHSANFAVTGPLAIHGFCGAVGGNSGGLGDPYSARGLTEPSNRGLQAENGLTCQARSLAR